MCKTRYWYSYRGFTLELYQSLFSWKGTCEDLGWKLDEDTREQLEKLFRVKIDKHLCNYYLTRLIELTEEANLYEYF